MLKHEDEKAEVEVSIRRLSKREVICLIQVCHPDTGGAEEDKKFVKSALGNLIKEVMYEEGEYFAKYHRIKFIETSAVTGENVQEAFTMVAREINARIESGALRLVDGWEGIKCGMSRSKSISLSDVSESPAPSSCSC
ncbi:unnamed protein product [Toxocara canis]|uniref:Uncharacterized protein n=1 Tax=Toxocara canis TaxID=6265 RepID=A0A3P7GQL8_TOXCA|nr:unnamed protein product [Toxocara canis]